MGEQTKFCTNCYTTYTGPTHGMGVCWRCAIQGANTGGPVTKTDMVKFGGEFFTYCRMVFGKGIPLSKRLSAIYPMLVLFIFGSIYLGFMGLVLWFLWRIMLILLK